ncbi:hypothetical protein TSUD_100890 [Trifolium subterraneum]|uniref:Replication protein A 70 kDa DNA-binding subunit B/D first OB fold domain-containing protein n=1 Tax=Trifolium subterraneum TaxID=3900 RepID=A0A2Z6PEX2_TRISU|nr:hypothetical protein TSUD_100890 [Trifolium subterraneum]
MAAGRPDFVKEITPAKESWDIVVQVVRSWVYERNRVTTKFKVIELESNGMKLECTLFGPYVDDLDAYLQSGYTSNVVVLAQFLKVKMYNGKIQLQNAMNCTKLLFNPEIPEANSFKLNDNIGSPTQPFSYMKDAFELSLEEEFLNLSQRKTIEELKDCQNNSAGVEDDLATGVVQNELAAGVVQDLNSKFENVVTEEKCEDNGSVSKPIEVDPADCAPVKRGFVEVAYENDGASSRILKNIKIEKD